MYQYNQPEGVRGTGKPPEEPERRRGVGEITKQKGGPWGGLNPRRTEKQVGFGETTNQKGVLEVGKTPEEPKSKWR